MLWGLLAIGLADMGLLAGPIHLCPRCSRHMGSMCLHLQEQCIHQPITGH